MYNRRLVLEIPVSIEELDWLDRAARMSGVTVEQLVYDALPLAGSQPELPLDADPHTIWSRGGL